MYIIIFHGFSRVSCARVLSKRAQVKFDPRFELPDPKKHISTYIMHFSCIFMSFMRARAFRAHAG